MLKNLFFNHLYLLSSTYFPDFWKTYFSPTFSVNYFFGVLALVAGSSLHKCSVVKAPCWEIPREIPQSPDRASRRPAEPRNPPQRPLRICNGPNTVSDSISNTELSKFLGPHRVPGRELTEFLSSYYLRAKANSPSVPLNSLSVAQHSAGSLFRKSALEKVFRPFPMSMQRSTNMDSWIEHPPDIPKYHPSRNYTTASLLLDRVFP